MKKKFMKRVATIILAASTAISLAGCGEMEPATTSNKSSGRVEALKDIWAPYDEPVTLTTFIEDNSGTEFQNGDDYGNNPWYRAYKERFNINLKNKWVTNDFNTKINLAIADKDIADVFSVDANRFHMLQEAGMIMSLDELFDRYASDTLKEYRKNYADTWDTAVVDDKLYALPQMSYGIIDQFQYVWIRQDWMQECDFEAPTSMDDVIEIATTFLV